jgi:hypoxanthine phosphoribosyltransferase
MTYNLDNDEILVKNFMNSRKDLNGDEHIWRMIMREEEINIAIQHCANQINNRFVNTPIVLVGILKGCVFFYADLCRRLNISFTCYFIEASSYHDSQTQSDQVEILSKLEPAKFKNRKVVLVDELFDNGLTLFQISSKLMKEPLNILPDDIVTCCLFRKDKKTNLPLPDIVGIDNLPDLWLIGMGLDDQQEKRGWPHLFAIPKAPGVPRVADDEIFENYDAYIKMRQSIYTTINSLK